MSETVLHIPEIDYGHDDRFDDPAFVADLYAGRLRFEVTWPDVLAMAIRDGAASVHYHPWRTNAVNDDALSYVVGGTRYGLLPPSDESGVRLLATARRLAVPGLFGRLRAWVTGAAVGRVRLVTSTGGSDWCVVCWGRGGLAGVDFLRLPPTPVVPQHAAAEAAPDQPA
jgi:hypothetical protein